MKRRCTLLAVHERGVVTLRCEKDHVWRVQLLPPNTHGIAPPDWMIERLMKFYKLHGVTLKCHKCKEQPRVMVSPHMKGREIA